MGTLKNSSLIFVCDVTESQTFIFNRRKLFISFYFFIAHPLYAPQVVKLTSKKIPDWCNIQSLEDLYVCLKAANMKPGGDTWLLLIESILWFLVKNGKVLLWWLCCTEQYFPDICFESKNFLTLLPTASSVGTNMLRQLVLSCSLCWLKTPFSSSSVSFHLFFSFSFCLPHCFIT